MRAASSNRSGDRRGRSRHNERSAEDRPTTLKLRNPHTILAALAVRPEDFIEIRVARQGDHSGSWLEVIQTAEEVGISIEVGAADSQSAQGRSYVGEADVKVRETVSISEMFSDPQVGDVWLGLDGVQDSRNIGAIARTAQFFGIRGIVLTRDRTAPITSISHDVAAGGLEVIQISQPPNLSKALSEIQSLGVWIVGTADDAEESLESLKPDRPWMILVGNEEKGLRRLTRDACDLMVNIPSGNQFVSSLNVSVAAGIAISTLKL